MSIGMLRHRLEYSVVKSLYHLGDFQVSLEQTNKRVDALLAEHSGLGAEEGSKGPGTEPDSCKWQKKDYELTLKDDDTKVTIVEQDDTPEHITYIFLKYRLL